MNRESAQRPGRGGASAEDGRSPGRRFVSGIKEILIVVIGAMLVSALLRAFVFEPFTIPSGSMENTLMVNDKVVAQKVTDFKRGDVIVFRDPGEWVPGSAQARTDPVGRGLEFLGVLPNSTDDFLTKRVIGTPGDRVTCCDAQGRMSVNGLPLTEGYLYTGPEGAAMPSDTPFDVVVPNGRLWVMGDHRNASADSRCHMDPLLPDEKLGDRAFVPIEDVVGPVGLIVSPVSRWQQLKTPESFVQIPAPAQPAPDQPEILEPAHC